MTPFLQYNPAQIHLVYILQFKIKRKIMCLFFIILNGETVVIRQAFESRWHTLWNLKIGCMTSKALKSIYLQTEVSKAVWLLILLILCLAIYTLYILSFRVICVEAFLILCVICCVILWTLLNITIFTNYQSLLLVTVISSW